MTQELKELNPLNHNAGLKNSKKSLPEAW